MMSSSTIKTKGSMSIWVFLLLITVVYVLGLLISHQVTKTEAVFWSGTQLQVKNKEGEWVNKHRLEVESEPYIQQVRFIVDIDDSDIWRQPISLILGGPFSAQILWDDELIGSKGTIGQTQEREEAGSIDYSVQVPQEKLTQNQHVIHLIVSTAHITIKDNSVLHYVWLAPYRKNGQRDMRYYLIPILISSGLLILSLQSLRIGRSENDVERLGLGIYGLFIVIALLSEAARAGINYPYNYHELRGFVGWCGVIGSALTLNYISYRITHNTLLKAVLCLGVLTVLLIHLIPFQSEDAQLALIFIVFLFAPSVVFVAQLGKKQHTYLSTLPVFCVASALSINLSVGVFLDSFLFVGSLIFVGGAWMWACVAIEIEHQETTADDEVHFLYVLSNGKEHQVAVSDCYALKAEGNYTAVHLQSGESTLHQGGIGAMLETGPSDFLRIHKSYAVNINAISTLKSSTGSKYWVTMKNGQRIPVSRYRVAELRSRLCLLNNN
jgi:hypothetical protein